MTSDNSFVHPVQFDQLNVETPELVERLSSVLSPSAPKLASVPRRKVATR